MNEQTRQKLEKKIVLKKEKNERKQFGQFSTPIELAKDIVLHTLKYVESKQLTFLEPAIGSGAFLSALLEVRAKEKTDIDAIHGIDIDNDYLTIAKKFQEQNKNSIFTNCNFLEVKPSNKYNLLISNPPYVRHQRLTYEQKQKYGSEIKNNLGIDVSGLSDLYIYFILGSHCWVDKNGIVSWLIPAEFLDVNYGTALKKYLLEKVTLLNVHIFDQSTTLFDSATVSSAVITYKMALPPDEHNINFTFGNDINSPSFSLTYNPMEFKTLKKWSQTKKKSISKHKFKISDFFYVKRGIATGDNKFFILNENTINSYGIETEVLTPILPSPRYLKEDLIYSNEDGIPILDNQQFLLNVDLLPEEVESRYPNAWRYLKLGIGTTSERYINKNRKVWYWQEKRLPAPIIMSYMSRSRTPGELSFRFIRNFSKAIVPNSYLMLYPKNNSLFDEYSLDEVYNALLKIEQGQFDFNGRKYGGGLKKIEPRELPNIAFSIE